MKPFSGGGYGGRTDIINVTGLDTTTGLLAEIKTPGEAAVGSLELQGYLGDYNALRTFNKTWIRDSFWNPTVKQFSLGTADPSLANVFGAIIANNNGVIIYTTYTVKQPPPFPVPLQVIEEVTESIYSPFPGFAGIPFSCFRSFRL